MTAEETLKTAVGVGLGALGGMVLAALLNGKAATKSRGEAVAVSSTLAGAVIGGTVALTRGG